MPVPVAVFYYPEEPSLCPQGVLVTGALPESGSRIVFSGVTLLRWDQSLGSEQYVRIPQVGETLPGEKGQGKTVAFRATSPALAPDRATALAGMPPKDRGGWDRYYYTGYMSTGVVIPTFSFQCQVDTPPVSVMTSGKPGDVLLVVEDPTALAKLRVVVQTRVP